MISVVVPTIAARKRWIPKMRRWYEAVTEDYELIVVHDYPTCSHGWNAGMLQAQGDYIHLSADDLEPHPGWWQAAIACCEQGTIPSARVFDVGGTLNACGDDAFEVPTGTPSEIARIPFFPRALMSTLHPILETQFMSDYWISGMAAAAGWPTVAVQEYAFTHHWAKGGRENYDFRADWKTYRQAIGRGRIRARR